LEALFERRGEARVLACLATAPEQGLRYTELARTVVVRTGFVADNTITRSLKRLVDEKLVEAVGTEVTRRSSYRLTPLGHTKATTLAFLMNALEERSRP